MEYPTEWAYEQVCAALAAAKEKNSTLKQALESIIIRCVEGDKSVDWLPTIVRIAQSALAKGEKC